MGVQKVVRRSLETIKARTQVVSAFIDNTETEIARLQARIRVARKLREKLGRQERIASDMIGRVVVVFVNDRTPWNIWLVDSVGPKQITIERAGDRSYARDTRKFNLDGTSVAKYCNDKIDIKATFGTDTIDAKAWKAMVPVVKAAT